jgi:hypothetical protein
MTISKYDKEVRILATKAHEVFCSLSHTDQCSWTYEKKME